MEYNIPAKPTKYKGRLYRSRLEARWAAFFDYIGWSWSYEPFEINGYNPDFIINTSSRAYKADSIIVEVKPSIFIDDDLINSFYNKYCSTKSHLLLLDENPFTKTKSDCNSECVVLGLCSQYFGNDVPCMPHDRSEIHAVEMKCMDDFGSSYMDYDGMVYGKIERKLFMDCFSSEAYELKLLWEKAANEVMFLKP